MSKPEDFLSEKAIARRNFFNIAIDSLDIPVNHSYIEKVKNKGAEIHCKSKWMNGVTIILSDSAKIMEIEQLPCVKYTQYTGKNDASSLRAVQSQNENHTFEYGKAEKQIKQLQGNYLHQLGYTGKGVDIALLDAGFRGVDRNDGFALLRDEKRLLGVKDFVNPQANLYEEHPHGSQVLSTIAGNIGNKYKGVAPDASFWLIRTEYAASEYLMETDFWVSGIEFADSAGVDIVNSSLGYSTFDDASMNFSYADMNGVVSRASRAATIASQKGIVVVNSAGNDGAASWHYIGVPADAKGIITVGSVDSLNVASSFSSFGPTADGRIKPEICAMGSHTALVADNGQVIHGGGTSYSSPIIAGLVACYLQYLRATHYLFTIDELQQSIFKSANLYDNPSEQMGYGIPNFKKAVESYSAIHENEITETELPKMMYDALRGVMRIEFPYQYNTQEKTVCVFEPTGRRVYKARSHEKYMHIATKRIGLRGVYIFMVKSGSKCTSQKVFVR